MVNIPSGIKWLALASMMTVPWIASAQDTTLNDLWVTPEYCSAVSSVDPRCTSTMNVTKWEVFMVLPNWDIIYEDNVRAVSQECNIGQGNLGLDIGCVRDIFGKLLWKDIDDEGAENFLEKFEERESDEIY